MQKHRRLRPQHCSSSSICTKEIILYWTQNVQRKEVPVVSNKKDCIPTEGVHNSALTWLGCSKWRLGRCPSVSTTLNILLMSSTPDLKSFSFHKHCNLTLPPSFDSLQPTTYKKKIEKGTLGYFKTNANKISFLIV